MRHPAIIPALVMTFSALSASAGEGLFSRTYTTETVPGGHFELEQTIRNRTGRAFGDYTAFDFRSEFEYGVTDNFQAALYFNSLYLHAKNASDDNDPDGETGLSRSGWFAQSISVELIYRIFSPIADPVGLALYYEPSWDFHDFHNGQKEYDSMENEFRILLQKNFLDDQFILAYNFILETEYFRYDGGETPWMGELDWNNELGGTYRVASNWYAGLELRNHNEIGNFHSHDHTVFWLGPAVHYGGPKFWATLGVLRQVSGNPNGMDGAGSFQGDGLFLHSHETWEATLKVAVPF